MAWRAYSTVLKQAWQRELEFRGNAFMHLLIPAIGLISTFYLWNNVYQGRATLAGYTHGQIMAYYIVVGFLLSALYTSTLVADDIQNGTLNSYLSRPISYPWYIYWQGMGRRLFRLLIGAPIIVVLFLVFHNYVSLPTSPWPYLEFFTLLIGASNILFLIDATLGLAEFWFSQSNVLQNLMNMVVSLLAGEFIPLAFLPNVIKNVSDVLPFKYTAGFPVEALVGRLDAKTFLIGLAVQWIWVGILSLLFYVMWRRGIKRYEAYGN